MIATVLLALGLVLVVEGLAYALAPSLIESMLAALRQLDIPQRRALGLVVLVTGVVLIWIAAAFGANRLL